MRKDDYTPSLEQMRDLYVRHADQLGIASDHVLHAEFDRFLAAAEQRGAAQGKAEGYDTALNEVASRGLISIDVHDLLNLNNPYRADQKEGDE